MRNTTGSELLTLGNLVTLRHLYGREERVTGADPATMANRHGSVVNHHAGERNRPGQHSHYRRADLNTEVDPPVAAEPVAGGKRCGNGSRYRKGRAPRCGQNDKR